MPCFLILNLRGIVGDHIVQITESRHVACLMWYIQISECSTLCTFCSACCSFAGKEASKQTCVSPEEMQLNLHKERGHANLSWEAWNDAKLGRRTVAGILSWGQVQLIRCASEESHWFTAAIYHLSTRRKLPFPDHTKCHKIISKPFLPHKNPNKLIKKTKKKVRCELSDHGVWEWKNATSSREGRSTHGLGSSWFMFMHCRFLCQTVTLRLWARTLWARILLIEGAFAAQVDHNHHSLDVTRLETQEHGRTVSKTTAKIRADRGRNHKTVPCFYPHPL